MFDSNQNKGQKVDSYPCVVSSLPVFCLLLQWKRRKESKLLVKKEALHTFLNGWNNNWGAHHSSRGCSWMAAAMQGLATMCNRRRKKKFHHNRARDSRRAMNKQHSTLNFIKYYIVLCCIWNSAASWSFNQSHYFYHRESLAFCKGFIRLEVHWSHISFLPPHLNISFL